MSTKKPEYEFGGPLGATAIMLSLPLLLNALYFGCNDISGCPPPALLEPSTLSWDKLKSEIPWPADGLRGFVSWKASVALAGYYLVSLVLYRVLPYQETVGTKLRESGKALTYRFNSFYATVVQLSFCAVGTYIYGANFPVWTFMTANYLQLLSASILLSFALTLWLYIKSFAVKPGNSELRELAVGGQTDNALYDIYIGRELNPRVTLPFFGEVDIKTWLEMRPGLTGWVLLNCAFIAQQYRNYGRVSDSILIVAGVQAYYVLEGQFFEAGLLGMMDITLDGMGFMLTFGDIVWVPFLYSTMCRYLSVYPVHLGPVKILGIVVVFSIGLAIFRLSNRQKYLFRSHPHHPEVKDLEFIQTKRGTRLLVGGWWGRARHVNYFGDWIQSLPFCLPTGVAGYLILPANTPLSVVGTMRMLDGRLVTQEGAAPWGMLITYLYSAYFASLLIHRERRDDKACLEKYGADWEEYRRRVRWRIIPGVY